jgi:hypothetical protein
MLLREDDRGVLAIGQASHAWISGQLARAWGSERFGPVAPHEEVCLAAEQHDVGMATWDLAPTRNPDTGLPHSFTKMPISTHLELWSAAPKHLLTQSRYAALLISMHGTRLYERRDLDKLGPHDAGAVRAYIRAQRELQGRLLESLRGDPDSAAAASAETVARNSDLIWTWDFVSLALCLGWSPSRAHDVPTADAPVELEIAEGSVRPWPFAADTVVVRCEGRRLTDSFSTDVALQEAFQSAPVETIGFELRKA